MNVSTSNHHPLRQRGFSLAVIIAALILWWVSGTQTQQQIDWLRVDYRLTPDQFQTFFLGAALAFVPVLIFEPWLRARLSRPGVALVVTIIATVLACGAVLVLIPDQPQRLFRTPNLLLYGILFVIAVCGLLVYGVSQSLQRWRGLLLGITGGLVVILLLVNVLAVGRFARFDDVYDEAYLASGGVNYALNGGISPSYTGSAYGDPDPALARFYVVMGLWLRLTSSTDLVALRSFSMLAGLVAVGITLVALRRQGLNWLHVVIGIAVLLGLSTFVRTTHNVRMDSGLLVCAALVLLFFLEALRRPHIQNRLFFMAGLCLYVGMESVPTVTLNFGVAVGIAVIAAALDIRQRLAWRPVLAYAVGAGIACFVYLLVHYAPDFSANIATMQDFSRVYVDMESVVAGQWERLLNFIRMSGTLSPIEPLLIIGLFVLLLWRGQRTDRLVALFTLLTLTIIVASIGGSYGYLAVLAPMVAYAAARVSATLNMQALFTLFMLPVLAVGPLNDMWAMIDRNPNATQLAEFSPVVEAIPEESTVIGPDLMWFVFNGRTDYIGWTGLGIYRQRRRIEEVEAIAQLAPDVLICQEDDPGDCTDYAPDVEPELIETSSGRYLLYRVESP
jgi:hypothetical protein